MPARSDATPRALETLAPAELEGNRLARKGTWVVAFVADWCPFCREFLPEFSGMAGRGFELARADVTSYDSALWDDYRIDVVPTVVVFRDGNAIFRVDGRLGEGLDGNDLSKIVRAASSPP